jgi:hypothetical protein
MLHSRKLLFRRTSERTDAPMACRSSYYCVYLPRLCDNSACWGDGEDEPGRPDITCTRLTEKLFVSLEGASLVQVVEAMNAPGLPDDGGVLRYVSNYAMRQRGGVGVVSFRFGRDRKVMGIFAIVDRLHGQRGRKFIWNVNEAGCSDFPGSIQRCDNQGGASRPVEQPPKPSKERSSWGWLSRWLGG